MTRCVALLFTASLVAQGPLNPTTNLTLDTNVTQGQFAFSSIDIPVGVRVTFTGSHAVRIHCSGNAVIRGRLDVDAAGEFGGPGWVTTGRGTGGVTYPSFGCPGNSTLATHGRHRGVYGMATPFDLAGGSPGGSQWIHFPASPPGCSVLIYNGGGGGGTVVLEATGRIDVHGMVSADGGYAVVSSTYGSGGSILLRGLGGLTVHPGALVHAIGAPTPNGAGIIRLDSYSGPPQILGIVDPPPLALELPYLEETAPPIVGQTWQLRLAAPRGDGTTLAVSFVPGSTTNQFGTVGIDLPSAIPFTFRQAPATGVDPLVTYALAIANNPGLIGIHLYVAGINWLTPLPLRFTTTVATVVQ